MTIPALTINWHDHYTPELRDRILAKLRTPTNDTTYQLLTPARLRTLAEIEAGAWPVVSLYLKLSPARRAGGAWQTHLASLVNSVLKPVTNHRQRVLLQEEFDRIEKSLADELPELGRGAAFFTCRKLGLWRKIAVSVPLPDSVHVLPQSYLRPLVRTRDEHDRFVLGVLSEEINRFFISQIGQVEEVFQVRGQRARDALKDHGPKDRPHVLETEPLQSEARILAHTSELVLEQFESRYLLFSGGVELRTAVIDFLPKAVQQRLGGEFSVEVHSPPAAVAAAAEPAQRAIEEREEVTTVQRLLNAGPSRSAWGVRATLGALRLGRVMTLVAEDSFTKPGARCKNCDALLEQPVARCPVCDGGSLEAVEDVVELAIENALEERSALEIVRSTPARQLMTTKIGPMAAVLRW
jgi:peptide subunit release factor 1 (eRF1)